VSADDVCAQCGHPFGPHVFIAERTRVVLGREIPAGGSVTCPVLGCDCVGTWDVKLPDDATRQKDIGAP
jgi:hypothetical protein